MDVRDAVISSCGLYRYRLTRDWDGDKPRLGFIMLNPSTADHREDDPTIRRCMGFARRDGFGGIEVVNLFAFRATKPQVMRAAADPVGPENDDYIRALLGRGHPVIAAWGANGDYRGRDQAVLRLARETNRADLRHLGLTAKGQPMHPLYRPGDQPFDPMLN